MTNPSTRLAWCAVTAAVSILAGTAVRAQTGGVPLWTNLYPGGNLIALAVDGSGNAIVTGSALGPLGASDFVTIKYSGAGTALWTNRYSGPGARSDSPSGIAVDTNDNVFVTGFVNGLGGATIKYSATGVPLWTNYLNVFETLRVAADASGNVFVAGSTGEFANADYIIVAYSNAGVPLWTNYYGGPRIDSMVSRGSLRTTVET